MELYLLKFSGCLVVFWLLYVLLLEKQKMHLFKRFYLLGAFVVSLIIPLLTITHYVEPVMDFGTYDPNAVFTPPYFSAEVSVSEAPPTNYLPIVLWSIYTIGVALFSIRFIVSLITMYKRIAKNETIKQHSFIYVLMQHYHIPHSFFNYLFFSKTKYETGTIPKEVIMHEETHARQLHSLDIMVVELLQIVFWFHPLVYLLKHHIKLNHEFLADQAVLENGSDAKNYQHILLQFSSSHHNNALSSAINYSSFKKRFTVMKTQTSKTKIWLSTLILLPILAILFYSFSEREIVEIEKSEIVEIVNSNKDDNDNLFQVALKNHYTKQTFKIKAENGEYISKKFSELSDVEKKKWVYVEGIPFKQKNLTESDFETYKSSEEYIIKVDSKDLTAENLNSYSASDFATYSITPISELAEMKQKYVLDLVSPTLFKSNIEVAIMHYEDVYPNYEAKLKKPQTYKPELELVGTYKFLKYNYDKFTSEMIEQHQLLPPTELSPEIIQQFEDYFKNTIEIYIDKNNNLFINDKPTSLETIKSDFDEIKKIEKPKVNLTTEERVNIKLIDKIMAATGTSISVGSGAEVYDNELLYAKINGRQINGVGTKLTVAEIEALQVGHKAFKVESFKIMFPDNKVHKVIGNTLGNKLKSKIEKLKPNEIITVFEILNTENVDIAPVLIEIIDKKDLTQNSPKNASEALMNEYKAFIKKYKETNIIYGDSYERAKIIYDELMSDAQRASVEKYPQPFVKVPNLSKTIAKAPTKAQFEDFKDAKTYAIWIDNKHVSNSELNNYQASDFVHYSGSKVFKNARSKKFPQPNQYHLYTKSGFKSTYQDSQLKSYKNASEKYSNEIKTYLKGSQTDNSELKILYNKALKIYNTFSSEELKKHSIKQPPPPPAKYSTPRNINQQKTPTKQDSASPKQVADYNNWAKRMSDAIKNSGIGNYKGSEYSFFNEEDYNKFERIFIQIMTPEQRKNVVGFPKIFPPPPPPPSKQNPPTAKEIREYNIWAKKISTEINTAVKNKSNEYPIIKLKDVERYKSILSRMSKKQKENAELFPNIDIIPMPTPHPGYKSKSKGGPNANQQAMIDFLKKVDGSEVIFTHVDAQKGKYASYHANLSLNEAIKLVEQDSKMKLYPTHNSHSGLVILISNNAENMIPKLTANNKVEHIQHLRIIGAKYYLNGEELTAKKAIKYVKRNPNVQIESTITPPTVNIQTGLANI